MIILTIDNSYSKITGLSAAQEKAIKEALSYTVNPEAAFYSRFGPQKKSLYSRGSFPTGLLAKVGGILMGLAAKYEIKDLRVRKWPLLDWTNGKVAPPHFMPYSEQINAIEAALKASRGTISMPTGTGKSMTMALLVNSLKVRTLIVVPNLELKKQLTHTFKQLFGTLKYITIENIDSPALYFETEPYGCLIIDEAHHVAAKTYQNLNKTKWNDIFFRFFFTATPFRNNKEETLLFEAIAGKVVYGLTYKTAINNGYIVPVEAYYIQLPKTPNDYFTWSEVYSNLVVKNDHRNHVIADLLLQLRAVEKNTLCLVKEVAHGQALAELTGIPFVHGQDEDSRGYIEDFNKGRINVLIGTTGVIGEGIDSRPCEFVVIAGLGKAKSAFMQQVGRGVRTFPGKDSAKIIIFKDSSHKFTSRHFAAQSKILLEEYGIKPLKLPD